MKLDLKQGNYHFVAYGGLACNKSSFLMKYTPGEGTGYTDLQVELDLECLTNPKRKNLHGLYWGELTLATADLYSEGTVEMMKNTNNIRVVLQQMNGEPVDDKKFEFEITDDNILFSYDNNLLENGMVTYTSWAQGQASAGFTDEGREVVVAYPELSTSRLMVRDWYSPKLTVRRKADGVEIININEANASGLSHNVFTQFDVSSSGAVFNNSVNDVNSQLAGMINGNSNFVNGIAAQTILNEVVSNNPSSLNGIMEIAGQKANLIIANQKGITGNGLGFINTDRAILTTGNPVLNEAGALTGFNVTEGTVAIAGTNNTSGADTTELLSKKVDVNGVITANALKVITGSNAIYFADLAYSNTNSDIIETGYAIDISAIGGMNGNSIYLMSSDKGVGVDNDGIIYGADNIELTSNGDIINNYAIVSDKNINLSAQKNIINRKRINANDSININVIN